MSEEKKEKEMKEGGAGKENEEEYDEDQEKNLDEILDELKEVEDEGEDERMDEGEHHDQLSDEENGEADEQGEGASQGKEEGDGKDKSKEEKEKEQKEERIDPSKGFLENEQDKMITGNWKYRMKIQVFNFEGREHNQENIERLINLSLSSAIYFFNNGHASGKILGRMEIFCSSQTTGELALETVLRHDVKQLLTVYIMRKVNIEDKELAYIKVMPYNATGMRFKPLHKVQPGGKPSSRSVKVSNIPEGTSDELLQALFPCCINIVKPEEVDGKSPGWAVLECLDKNSMISLLKTYKKAQISSNLLELSACYKSKSASALVDEAKKKEIEEAKAKKEGEEKKEKKDDDGDEKDDEEEEEDEGEEKSEKHSTRKSSVADEDVGMKKHGVSYRGMRGGPIYRPRGAGRYRPYDRYQDHARSYVDRRETEALKDQIAILQENISMLTQSMTPMMMGGGGGGCSGHSSMSRRQRSDSGRYRDEYTTSNRYSTSSRDYVPSSSYGGGNSWAEAPYSTGASRKRSYNWDDDYGSTSSRNSYKKYY